MFPYKSITLNHFLVQLNNFYSINSILLIILFYSKTGNNVSEFTHSNCITLSYYSSPKHNESAS